MPLLIFSMRSSPYEYAKYWLKEGVFSKQLGGKDSTCASQVSARAHQPNTTCYAAGTPHEVSDSHYVTY